MKKTNIPFLIFVLLLLYSVTTKAQPETPLFTFCGQSGELTMTWKDFSKCKTELTPISPTTKIISFTVSILTVFNKDTTWVDRPNTGNVFDEETLRTINKLYNSKKMANQILINEVIISRNKIEDTAPKMTINLKD